MSLRKQILSYTGAGIVFMLMLISCIEFEPVSPIPEITYKKLVIALNSGNVLNPDSKVIQLSFDFIDGDADIGWLTEEEYSNYDLPDSIKNSLFISLYKKIDSTTYEELFLTQLVQEVIDEDTIWVLDTLSLNQPIFENTKLDRVGQNKTVKGAIQSNIEYNSDRIKDTLRIEFYIRDRARNKSNVEVTDDFLLNELTDETP